MKQIYSMGAWCLVALVCVTTRAQFGPTPPHDMPVYVNDSPDAQKELDEAGTLVQQNRYADAAEKYQHVIEQYEGKLILSSGTIYVEVERIAREKIAANPQLLAAYRSNYEPRAHRMLESAGGDARMEDLAHVVHRYRLCPSGFEAGLQLASLFLESARPDDAAAVLDVLATHPDMNQAGNKLRWQALVGAADLFAGRRPAFDQALKALADLGQPAEAARDQLNRWAASIVRPSRPVPITPSGGAGAITVPDALALPLWKVPLHSPDDDDPNQNGNPNMPRMIGPNGQPMSQVHNSVVPVCLDETLYLNTGNRIMALDRSSGRVLWSTRGIDPAVMRMQFNMGNPMFNTDERSVAIEGARLFAVVGQSMPFYGMRPNQYKSVFLVCLNRQDGKIIWRADPGSLDEGLGDAAFHGTPIVKEGRVFALLRRSQFSGFHAAFVVALDANTGKLIWKRHLTSSVAGMMNQQPVRPLSQMLVADGKVFVVDNLGAAACLDARTGLTLWLTTADHLPNAMDVAFIRAPAPAWQCGPPVLVEAGLIVPAITRGANTLLLDPATGVVKQELDADKEDKIWSQGYYLAPVGPDVLIVGEVIRLMDGKTLTQKWGEDLSSGGRAQLQGRVAITADRVVMPFNGRIAVLDLKAHEDKNQLIAQPIADDSGNVLALDRQILICDGQTLQSYMSFDDAYNWTKRQIEARPTDPQPALALAHLAISAEQDKALIEGVDLALQALRNRAAARLKNPPNPPVPDPAPHEVFTQILNFVDPASETRVVVKDPAIRKQLFDRLANATTSPSDEVAYHLTLGDFYLETGDPAAAVDQYQAILSAPTLDQTIYIRNGTARQGGLEARERLAHMIANPKYGPAVYAKYEALASQRLAELLASDSPDPQALLEIARKYPAAQAAAPATIAAADQTARAGDRTAALSLYRTAYYLTSDKAMLQKVVGKIVELFVARGDPRLARPWLLRAARRDIQPLRDGKPVSPASWLAELARLPSPEDRLPTLSRPLGQPIIVAGGLLTPAAQPRNTWPSNLILTRTAAAIQLRKAPSFNIVWEAPAINGQVKLLALNDEQALLWNETRGELLALNAATGAVMWPQINAKATLDAVNADPEHNAAMSPEQRRFEQGLNPPNGIPFRDGRNLAGGPPQMPGYKFAVNDMVICLADAAGRVVGFDRHTGRLLWRLQVRMDQVRTIVMDEDSLAIAGLTGVKMNNSYSGALLILDPLTGQARTPAPIEDAHPMNWLGLTPDGLIVFVALDQVAAYQSDGKSAWRYSVTDKTLTGLAQLQGESLAVQDSDGAVLILDPSTGELRHRVGMARKRDTSLALQFTDHHWYFLTGAQAAAATADGRIAWYDALSIDDTRVSQLVGQDYVALLALPEGGMRAGAPGVNLPPGVVRMNNMHNMNWTYEVYLLNRASGIVVDQQALGPMAEQVAPDAVMLNDYLVYSTSASTIVIPGHNAVTPAPAPPADR